MKISPQEREILTRLAQLGGAQFSQDDIRREGRELILPEGMSYSDAVEFIQFKASEQQSVIAMGRTFKYRPWDGAVATQNALKNAFGAVAHKGARGFFGDNPPEYISVPVSPAEVVQVPWGRFELPLLPGAEFAAGMTRDDNAGLLYRLDVTCRKMHAAIVEGIFAMIENELTERSIYRGRAFDGQEQPEFVDVDGVDPAHVVYSDATMRDLETHVWAQLDRTAEFEAHGVPMKRAVLLHGPFGTGKTLAITLTGQRATAAGWTFIVARPGRDDLLQVIETARLYEPAVVVFEDVDRLTDPNEHNGDAISRVLDVFDGIQSKGTRILAVLTTNHADRIHAGMLRPGRLDACIEIARLDPGAVERLVRLSIPATMLADSIEWPVVLAAVDGYLPAFIGETAQRAVRYGLTRVQPGETPTIDTESLVLAAESLRFQHDLHAAASTDNERPDALRAAMIEAVAEAMSASVAEIENAAERTGDRVADLATDIENVGESVGRVGEVAEDARTYASSADDHGQAIRDYHGV